MAKINWNDFEAQYGWAKAVLTSSPELKRLAERAVKNGYTQQKFIAELRGTKWFRKHSESWRQAQVLRKTDPGEWKRRIQQMDRHIRTLYAEMAGGRFDTKAKPGDWIRPAAEQAVMLGWTEEEIRAHIARSANFAALLRKDRLGGEAGQLEDFIRKSMGDYGVTMTDKWIGNRIRDAMLGKYDQDAILETIKKNAKSKYRAFADDIDNGVTIRDVADSYIQSYAKILEVDPESVGLDDHLIQKALTRYDMDKGKAVPIQIPEFEQMLRKDPRWNKTNNARDELIGLGHRLLSDLGLVA